MTLQQKLDLCLDAMEEFCVKVERTEVQRKCKVTSYDRFLGLLVKFGRRK